MTCTGASSANDSGFKLYYSIMGVGELLSQNFMTFQCTDVQYVSNDSSIRIRNTITCSYYGNNIPQYGTCTCMYTCAKNFPPLSAQLRASDISSRCASMVAATGNDHKDFNLLLVKKSLRGCTWLYWSISSMHAT